MQVQASHGLGARLPDDDLGWEAELGIRAGRLDGKRHVVDMGHGDVLLSGVDLVTEYIAALFGSYVVETQLSKRI